MKIICIYHCPCLDGAYSALFLFAFIKSLMQESKADLGMIFKRLLEYSSDKHEKTIKKGFEEEEKITEKIEEEEKEPLFETFFLETGKIQDFIEFYGVKPSKNTEVLKSLLRFLQNKSVPEETIMILLDYYGESLENLEILGKLCLKLIVIDHHESFFDLLSTGMPDKNLTVFGRIERSGCFLTYEFLSGGFGDVLPLSLGKRLLTLAAYIEDHDIKARRFVDTDAIITALFELITDFSFNSNPMLFSSLVKYDVSILKELGTPVLARKRQRLKTLVVSARKVRIPMNQSDILQGYALRLNNQKDRTLINDLGEALAGKSINENMDNFSVIYMEKNDGFRVCLRGMNSVSESPCLSIAKSINGGGHKYAAGGWISKKTLQKWLKSK